MDSISAGHDQYSFIIICDQGNDGLPIMDNNSGNYSLVYNSMYAIRLTQTAK